jgi:protein-tyrosine phosphatase
VGIPTSPPVYLAAAADVGVDLTDHQPVQVTAGHLASADLVLGATRAHVRELVVLDGDVWPRTFTVKEFVRRGREHGPRPYRRDLRSWAGTVSIGRTIRDLLGESDEDDIADPFGGSDAGYRRTAAELDTLVTELAAVLWPPGPRRVPG